MASLIEQELARRDSAVAPQRASTRSTYMAPADRLRAAEIDRRAAKDEGDIALRESLMEQRARAAEMNANRLKEDSLRRGEYQDNRLKLAEDAARLEALESRLKEQEQLTKMARTEEILTQATDFLRDSVGMDPSKPEFDIQFQRLQSGYPLAAAHPSVQMWKEYHLPLRKEFVAEEIARRAVKPPGVRDFGTETVNEKGEVSKTYPIGSPEEQAARDLREHNQLEKLLSTNPEKEEKAALIGRMNKIKSRLGFDLMDAETGAVIPNSGTAPKAVPAVPVAPVVAAPRAVANPGEQFGPPAPVAAPATTPAQAKAEVAAATTVAPASIGDKAAYDALPSGAEFIWNGRRGKKP